MGNDCCTSRDKPQHRFINIKNESDVDSQSIEAITASFDFGQNKKENQKPESVLFEFKQSSPNQQTFIEDKNVIIQLDEQEEKDQQDQIVDIEELLKQFDPKTKFNFKKLQLLMNGCAKTVDNLDIRLYVAMTDELSKLLVSMGTFLKRATDEIKFKSNLLIENRNKVGQFYEINDNINLWDFIKFEKQIGVHTFNDDNNKKQLATITDRKLLDLTKTTYESTARTLVRLWWFAQFICKLFTSLRTTTKSFSDCAAGAYKTTLQPHHSWSIVLISRVALTGSCSREFCLEQMGINSFEETSSLIKDFETVKNSIRKFLSKEKLTNLE